MELDAFDRVGHVPSNVRRRRSRIGDSSSPLNLTGPQPLDGAEGRGVFTGALRVASRHRAGANAVQGERDLGEMGEVGLRRAISAYVSRISIIGVRVDHLVNARPDSRDVSVSTSRVRLQDHRGARPRWIASHL